MDVKPTGSKDNLPDNQESQIQGRFCSQLKRELVNIDNANEPLIKITKQKESSSFGGVKQHSTELLTIKENLEKALEQKQEQIKIIDKLTQEYIENKEERDAQLAYLNEHNLNDIKEIEKQLAEINKLLSEVKKEDASSRSGS